MLVVNKILHIRKSKNQKDKPNQGFVGPPFFDYSSNGMPDKLILETTTSARGIISQAFSAPFA